MTPSPILRKKRKRTVGTDMVDENREKTTMQNTGEEQVKEAKKDEEEEYVVSKILDHFRDKTGKDYYRIKWEGYPVSQATWEPEDHLNCNEIIEKFRQERRQKHLPQGFSHEMKQSMQGKLADLFGDCGFRDLEIAQRGGPESTEVRFKINIKQLKDVQNRELIEWKDRINKICQSVGEAAIEIENNVDFECIPKEFTYITDYKFSPEIRIDAEAIIGCECAPGECNAKSCKKNGCCPELAGGHEFRYTWDRKVNNLQRRPIYECNSKCKCGPDCQSRIVQKGRRIPLKIFRTKGKGWGVKTLKRIPERTFVTEYVGEVIGEEEAERRGKVYDAEGATYLFDLDYEGSERVEYAVDAKYFGNIAHFINHSCEPNLQIFCVWVECHHPTLPRLAFFSTRAIEKDEELTFDYRMSSADPEEDVSADVTRIPCNCLSKNCKKFL